MTRTRQAPAATARSVTLDDVAREAGVSRATASRVVRGDNIVSQDKVRAVDAAVTKLGYIPNVMARSLVTRRCDLLAIVVPETSQRVFSDPFLAASITGVHQALAGTSMQPVIIVGDAAGRIDHVAHFLRGRHVDGAVVVSHHRKAEQVHALARMPVPLVFIGRPDDESSASDADATPYYWVDSDNYGGGVLAARHLSGLGVRRPALITGPLDMNAARARRQGFVDHFARLSRRVAEEEGRFTRESGRQAMEALLRRDTAWDGLFVCSDLMAFGALDVLNERGIRVPEEIPLIGFDDVKEAAISTPALTTVTNPAADLAACAAQMVRDLVDGREVAPERTLPVDLVIRDSA